MLRLLTLLACLLGLLTAPAALQGERPNVVVIVWNDAQLQRLGFLGAAGEAHGGVTPRLDALLAEGARFADGVLPAAHGRPAAAALLSGRLPHRNGIYYQVGPKRLAAESTLPALLHAQGYANLHVGRFREGPARDFGFDAVAEGVLENGSGALASFVAEHAGKQPLCIWWAPEIGNAFGAKNLDEALGELLDALALHGQRENTLYAFVASGEPHGREFSAQECAAARMRTPLGLVWKGQVPAGEHGARVSALDLFPTLLECLALPLPAELDGVSLRPLLGGGELPARALGAAFFAPQTGQSSKGGREYVRDLQALVLYEGPYKYALFLEDIGVKIDPRSELVEIERSAGDQQLFDLDADPREEHDLFPLAEQAERLAALRARALAWWARSGAPEFKLPFLPPALGPAPKEPRPNIVLVVADDMDYEHLGFMGNPRVHTPTIDALAREGLVFPVAHVPMSRCRPALAALLSGRWPHQTGIYENNAARTLTRQDSLPNLLKAAGYATFQGGKFWEGSQLSMGFIEPRVADSVFKNFVRESQDELFGFIDRWSGERPLFVWWAPMLPHGPFNPPQRYQDLFTTTEVPVPAGIVGDPRDYQEQERTAYAMGAWLDDGLRALREKLAARGELEDTLFVFVIDNGYVNGAPSKGTVFEKGLRTPVFFSWPKGIAGGRTSPQLVCAVDLYATILDYAGVPVPAAAAGVDLRPTLEGKEQVTRTAINGAVYRYKERAGPLRAEKDVYALYARTERWKFVLYLRNVEPESYLLFHDFAPFPARQRGDRNLYDLAADPYEQHDLSGDSSHAALMDELLQGCLAWWRASGGGELDLP